MSFSEIGHYQVIEEIGRGDFSTVYRAHDSQFKRDVALKVISLWEEERLRLLFLRKVQSLLSFEHPAVVPIYDFGQENGNVFIVSKLMSGGSLATQLEQKTYSFDEIAPLFAALAPALDEAHANQMTHDHLKPSNILFDHHGKPCLADFGLRQFLIETHPPALRDELTGHPVYNSPEQLRAIPQRDARSDIYALGVILFELLTGQVPYQAYTTLGIALAHINDPIPDVAAIRPDLPIGTQQVIERALAKAPEKRYPTVMALSEAVITLVHGPKSLSDSSAVTKPVPEPIKPSKKLLQYVSAKKEDVPPPSMAPYGIVLVNEELDPEESSGSPPQDVQNVEDLDQENQPSEVEPVQHTAQEANQAEALKPKRPKSTGLFSRRLRWASALLFVVLLLFFGWSYWNRSLNQAPPPPLEIGSTQTSSKDNAVMVYVPAGDFTMGSQTNDPNAYSNEKPQHLVYLDAFWIDQTEVTNAMFARFIEESNYQTDAEQAGYGLVYLPSTDNWEEVEGANWQHPVGPDNNIIGLDNYPVVQVSWNDAKAYCEWAGRRLPTEAEWEKAARGTNANQYPWGNEFNGQSLNYCDSSCLMSNGQDHSTSDGYPDLALVGNYPTGRSPYHALDMSGNVWEWVNDWFDETYYQTTPANNPPGPESGTYRIIRGGSWSNGNIFVRSAVRTGTLPTEAIDNLGFRCAVSP